MAAPTGKKEANSFAASQRKRGRTHDTLPRSFGQLGTLRLFPLRVSTEHPTRPGRWSWPACASAGHAPVPRYWTCTCTSLDMHLYLVTPLCCVLCSRACFRLPDSTDACLGVRCVLPGMTEWGDAWRGFTWKLGALPFFSRPQRGTLRQALKASGHSRRGKDRDGSFVNERKGKRG